MAKEVSAAERASESTHAHKERAGHRIRKVAEPSAADSISPPPVRALKSPAPEAPPVPAVAKPDTTKKRIRHFDPDNPYGP